MLLQALAGNDTWTGGSGDNNWSTAKNWSGTNAPVAGDIISFGAQGAGGSTLNNNLTVDTALLGLDFNATAPSFVLTGNEIVPTGAIVDNSLNLQTINLPIATTMTKNIGAASGSTLVIGGVISGTGGGINKISGGTVTLNKNNTYTGGTIVSAGTLTLDYTGGATSIIPSTSALTLGGGALNEIGSSAATAQTVNGVTFNPGASTISASGSATLTLGAMIPTAGVAVMFNGPATTTYSGGNSVVATPVAATGTIKTTTVGAGTVGLINNVATGATASTMGAYGTVGLYDWAATTGTSPYTIVGGSQVTGFYVTTFASDVNMDVPAAGIAWTGTEYGGTLRFNTPSATPYTPTTVSGGGANIQMIGILVTPNMGAQNAGIANGTWSPYYGTTTALNDFMQIWQNNTLGYFNCAVTLYNGRGATPSFDGIVQNGPGTVVYSGVNSYSNATYLNGGYSVISANSGLGYTAKPSTVYMNGGTICGTTNFALDNGGGASPRPISLLGNGGGLAATATNTMTVDGVISGAIGTGPLTIGIPASSANNYTAGLLPGSGTGTANTTPVMASGTVALTGANTYTGNTTISSGTLQLGATGVILSTNIITSPGGTYDVSLISGYTLNGGYNLMGGGAVNGSVNAASGSGIYGGTDGTYGTNTFNNNLTLASGAAVYFDLGASATGPNDQIVVNGNLTFNGNVIHLKAPSTAAILDMVNDYTLFSSPNLITVASTPTIVWDVPPANNWPKYILVVAGNTVRLHYVASPGPFIVSSSALPNPAYDNENILISAMVMTNGSTLKSITVDASQIAGTAPGTTILTLVSTGTANPTIYTNSVTVGAAVPIGTVTYYSTAIDNANITFLGTNTLSIISGVPVMSGVTAVPNPVSPGQLVTVTATVVGYPIRSAASRSPGARSAGRR